MYWARSLPTLSLEAVRSILDGVALGITHRAESYDPAVVEGDHGMGKEVCVTAGQLLVEMHVTNWAEAQREDPVLGAVLDWLEAWKKTGLKTLLGEYTSSEEGQLVLRNHQNFMIHQKALYICSITKAENENLLVFVVPRAHWVTALNGCHQDAGHQGLDHTLSLLQGSFCGQGWVARCSSPSGPAHAVYSMRAACPRPPYILSWPLLPWISYMLTSPT